MDCSHENAFGVNLPKNKLEEITKKCNELVPIDTLTTYYQCDWEIPAAKLKREYVQEVAENYSVFGSTVPTPMFVITDLEINASQIMSYGENATFIRFVYNGITFVKKYCSHDDFDNMTLKGRSGLGVNKKNLRLNLICQFALNVWEDKVVPQVVILDFDSEEVKNDQPNKSNILLGKSTSKNGEKTRKTEKNGDDDWDFEERPIKSKKSDDLDFDW